MMTMMMMANNQQQPTTKQRTKFQFSTLNPLVPQFAAKLVAPFVGSAEITANKMFDVLES